MAYSLLFMLVKWGWFALCVVALLPGFIFGYSLARNTHKEKETRGIYFILISGISYLGCFLLSRVYYQTPTPSPLFVAFKILYSSCVGSMILSISYQILVLEKINLYRTISTLIFVGVISAIPSCASFYFILTFQLVDFNYNVFHILLTIGTLSIYPLWQLAFVWVMNMERFKPVSEKTATAS